MFKKSVLILLSNPLKRKDSFFGLKQKLQETTGEIKAKKNHSSLNTISSNEES